MKEMDDYPARYWQRLKDGRVRCDLCPRYCKLQDSQRGFCFVRMNRNNTMVLTTYGRSSGFCIDPIEKKPLNHFYPGSSILSFGTAGCNLGCKFCQNWNISKSRQMDRIAEHAMPDRIAAAAKNSGCKSVAYTYNDPVIFAEYAIDIARECRESGVKNVAVTAAYITETARPDFFEYMDAANVDLKAFSENFYKKYCLGKLQPVLDTLKYLKHETDVWIELTTLLIPGLNDSDKELGGLSEWVAAELGTEVPMHFTAFHPDYKVTDRPRTPVPLLNKARDIALSKGIRYVYTGNVTDRKHASTYCPECGKMLIEREWYDLHTYNLEGNSCKFCGALIAGHFETQPGSWGSRRRPVAVTF
ncbi:AmmeMemoRadiSam system radical SAM enzyme [candidate division KSB1 bacterium]